METVAVPSVPSPQGWNFIAFDPGGMDGNSAIAFDVTSDELIFPGYFSLVYWNPLSGSKTELRYDESDVSCACVSVLVSSSGQMVALVGQGYVDATTEQTTWVRAWTDRLPVWHQTYGVSWPTVADISPDDSRIAIGTGDGSILVVSSADGTTIASGVTSDRKRITGIAFSQDAKTLVTADECGLTLWSNDLSSSKRVYEKSISSIHKLPSIGAVLVRGASGSGLWDTANGECVGDLSSSEFALFWSDDVAVSHDGCLIAQNRGALELLDVRSGHSVASIELEGQGEDADAVAFSSGGGLLALVDSLSGNKWVWRAGAPL